MPPASVLPVPVVELATPSAPPAAPAAVAPAAAPPAPPQVTLPAPAAPVQSATAPQVQARRQLPTSAVRYLAPPPAEVPRASRRAGESGTVWLKVVVSPQGLPVQVSLHRSSGFARLDEQALWAMRQARFKPSLEDGNAVEVEVLAPIEYPAD